MAENDVASEAYQYEYLIMADIKNFYPSIYTLSLAWAIHSVAYIRAKSRRHNYLYLGNRIDRLFRVQTMIKQMVYLLGQLYPMLFPKFFSRALILPFQNLLAQNSILPSDLKMIIEFYASQKAMVNQ
jgi:hypothetical protein